MNILVFAKMVPDLVEELSVDSSGARLDLDFARFIISEFDEHAIEQAILLKEEHGGSVTVVGFDDEGIDDVLYTSAAKGADHLIKLPGISAAHLGNHLLARIGQKLVTELHPDLILTGVQAHNDLDGSLGVLLAGIVSVPYVGYVSGVALKDEKLTIRKEYPGGLIAELEAAPPIVLGIQSAAKPPRYVAVSKVRQAMKTATIEEREAAVPEAVETALVSKMYKPDSKEHATMLGGTPDEVAGKLVGIFKELGVL